MKNTILLTSDDKIKDTFNNKDYSIFVREGNSGEFEKIKPNISLEDIIDATSMGFEFIAVKNVSFDKMSFPEYNDKSIYEQDLTR